MPNIFKPNRNTVKGPDAESARAEALRRQQEEEERRRAEEEARQAEEARRAEEERQRAAAQQNTIDTYNAGKNRVIDALTGFGNKLNNAGEQLKQRAEQAEQNKPVEPAAEQPTAWKRPETKEERMAERQRLETERAQKLEEYNAYKEEVEQGQMGPPSPEQAEMLLAMEAEIDDFDRKIKEVQEDVDYGKVLDLGVTAGLEGAGLQLTKGLDWLAGENSLPWKAAQKVGSWLGFDTSDDVNPITALKNKGEQEVAYWNQKRDEATEGNDFAQSFGKHVTSIAQSSPFVVLNLMTLGGSGALSASTEGLKYASRLAQTGGGKALALMAEHGMKAIAANPAAQYSFATQFGDSYEEALADGASPVVASMYATLTSAFGAMIEVGGMDEAAGGLQGLSNEYQEALARGDKSFLLRLLKADAQEVGEEELQYLVGEAAKGLYQDVNYTQGEDAVLNPKKLAQIAKDTAIDTSVMAGGQMAGQYGLNRIAQNMTDSGTGTPMAPADATVEALTNPSPEAARTADMLANPTLEAQENVQPADGINTPAEEQTPNTEPVGEFNTAPAESTARQAAKTLIADTGTRAKPAEVEAALQTLADYVQSNNNGQGINEEELHKLAENAAALLINNIPGDTTGDSDLYNQLRAVLKNRRIAISDEMRGEVTDYKEWRKELRNKLMLRANGEGIDSLYQELGQMFGPGLFPQDVTSQTEMVDRIVQVLDGTKPQQGDWVDQISQEDYDQAVAEMTQRILDMNLTSGATALSDESLASLEGEAPPPMINGTPTVESTVPANGPTKERGFAENMRTSETTEEALKKSLGKDLVTYQQLCTADVLEKAQQIYDGGLDGAKAYLDSAISAAKQGGVLPQESIPLARMVANEMARNGDVVGGEKLIADVAAELTRYGQITNLAKTLRQSIKTPEGKLYAIQKVATQINEDPKNKANISIPQELFDEFAEQTTDEGRDDVIKKMQQSIADQTPTSLMELWNAFRYTAMLGNFKTQSRNLAGNTIMQLERIAKSRISALMEGIPYLLSGGKTKRNQVLWAGKDLYKAGWEDFATVRDETLGNGKYSDYMKQLDKDIQGKRRIIKLPGNFGTDNAKTELGRSSFAKMTRNVTDTLLTPLELWRKGTNTAMEVGDVVFNHVAYADALAGYLKGHGITAEQWAEMVNDPFQQETVDAARQYAIKEAQESTFRDDNAFSNAISKAFRGNKTPWWLRIPTEGTQPFLKTPANVTVRMEEYGPLGFINAAFRAAQAANKNSDVTWNDAANQLSKALTGTGVMALGAWLRSKNMLRGKDEDDKQGYFDKLRGDQDYSITLGDKSCTIEWASPASAELFMGSMLYDAWHEHGLSVADFTSMLEAFGDPLLEQSMVSGITDALDVIRTDKSGANPLVLLFLNGIAGYLSQGFPTLMGQAERYGEDYRQSTYTNKESPIPTSVQKKISQVFAKIPGLDYQQGDYIDAWGRKQEQKKGVMPFLETFVTPWYSSEDKSTPIDDELQRLYDAGTGDSQYVFPVTATRNPGYGLGQLNNEEYETFATTKGQTSLSLVQDFIESEEYKDLSDDERATVIKEMYNLAKDLAVAEVLKQRGETNATDKRQQMILALTDTGMDSQQIIDTIMEIGGGDGKVSQADMKTWYAEHPEDEETIAALWDAAGFTGTNTSTFEKYKESQTWKTEEAKPASTKPKDVLLAAGVEEDKVESMEKAMNYDGKGSITQKDMMSYFLEHPDDEAYVKALWDSRGYDKDWETYKEKHKAG